MSANDYIAMIIDKNPALFRGAPTGKRIQIPQHELIRQIRLAFEAGKESGMETQSLFKKLFG